MEEINNLENFKQNYSTAVVHNNEWKTNLSIVLTVIMTVLTIISLIVSIALHNDNIRRDEAYELKVAQNELHAQQQAAVPYLHTVHNQNAFAALDLYDTVTEMKEKTSYFHIEDFYFENMLDNSVQFSHIEYGNHAYQVKDHLVAIQGQVIQFSPDLYFEFDMNNRTELYIVVYTVYGQYFSYECELYQTVVHGYNQIWVVDRIKAPVSYDTNNSLFKSMTRHYPKGNIIF